MIDRIANRLLTMMRQDIPQTDEAWAAAMAEYEAWVAEIDGEAA